MMMIRHSIFVIAFLACVVSGFASQRPWRDPRYPHKRTGQEQQRYSHYGQRPPFQVDYSSHFLDREEWMHDKRARISQINLKSRQLGALSFTSKIVATNLAAYAIQVFFPSFTNWGVKISDKILRGQELHRLVTPMFLHGNVFHLWTNLYSLQQVGPSVEKIFGPGRFVALYAVSGVAGTLASAFQSPNPSLGASGAVFGVVAAYFVFLTRNSWLLGPVGESMSSSIAQTMILNIGLGLMNPMIDNWGHIGGALGGAAMAYYFGPRLYLSERSLDDIEDYGSGDGNNLIIDRPMIRLPRRIEAFPENFAKRMQRIIRRMQIERYKADLPDMPWRPRKSGKKYYDRPAPNRSIKPKKF